jgi:hypothetical protein
VYSPGAHSIPAAVGQLNETCTGFTGTFLAVQFLDTIIRDHPDHADISLVNTLIDLVATSKFEKKKQSYFLYRQACALLIYMIEHAHQSLAVYPVKSLQALLLNTSGNKKRAISEALGSLPLQIKGPVLKIDKPHCDCQKITFESFMHQYHVNGIGPMSWKGRTLVTQVDNHHYLCLKFARSQNELPFLNYEIEWMKYLKANWNTSPCQFHIPAALFTETSNLFQFDTIPHQDNVPGSRHHPPTAIAFIVHKNYFDYPNRPYNPICSNNSIYETFGNAATILGKMVSSGIVHTALIPLFHNRVQQDRREDQGVYNWRQSGRLDQWLASCRYPNFASSGIRDFEHLETVDTSQDLYHHIGEHILSFVLVLASCFRGQKPRLKGYTKNGSPVDARHLFDRSLFKAILIQTVSNYCQQITGHTFKHAGSLIDDKLIDQLIDAMGVDHHMEERVRITDQNNMSAEQFYTFLKARGMTAEDIDQMEQGKNEIIINTGPHLGGFNQPISTPLLIDRLFSISSLCISDRYILENGLKASGN